MNELIKGLDSNHWLQNIRKETLNPRINFMKQHPFTKAMKKGSAEPKDIQRYFAGLMWHLHDFDKHVAHLFKKRGPEAAKMLEGRSEDTDGDIGVLSAVVEAFGGPAKQIDEAPWSYKPHNVWIEHDALLRAAIYSEDLPWQVGTAALNAGIEYLVPHMIGPLLKGCVKNYGLDDKQVAWLVSRSGEEEIQHGENAFILLSEFVDPSDGEMVAKCEFFIDQLSYSMSRKLLDSGLPQ